MSAQVLFSPFRLGEIELKNRMVMAPMTRNRAINRNVPHEMNAQYYDQRATAGLIITEATQVSAQGVGYPNTPGIHTERQVEGWRKVTTAVHERDGKIFLQLWHVGRISHPDFHNGDLPVAPSAVKPDGQAYTPFGMKDFVEPRALELEEIPGIVEDFRRGAENAKAAGFDGVEIHAANGYLIDQFLQDITNKRKDAYGGSVENRARFFFEVLEAVLSVWEPYRVGIRLSPSGIFNSMGDSNPTAIFGHVIQRLNDYPLAYLHLVGAPLPLDKYPQLVKDVAGYYGKLYKGVRMVNGGYTHDTANEVIENGTAELVSFGVPFLANPDLPRRFELGAELNHPDQSTFYGGCEKGYIDYPFLKD